MAMQTSLPAVMDALIGQLQSRSKLHGVLVRSGVGREMGKPSLELFDANNETTWAALGQRNIDEEYTLNGLILGYSRGGDSEQNIKAARDNAFMIWDELLQQLQGDPRVGGTVSSEGRALVTAYNHTPTYDSTQRISAIEFTITVNNRLRV